MTNIPSSTSPMPARNRVAIPIRIPSDGECYRSGWVLVAFENQAAYPQVFGILSGFEGIGATFHPGIRFEMDVGVDGAFEKSINVAHGRSPTGERLLGAMAPTADPVKARGSSCVPASTRHCEERRDVAISMRLNTRW